MTTVTLDTPVGQLVAERPARARVLERLGIDYCCGGRRPLVEACALQGLDAQAVLRDLEASETERLPEEATDWTRATLAALADHIEARHHGYLREALPRLTGLVEKVRAAHGEGHPELDELQRVFLAFRAELEAHMQKEERVLFPLCRALELDRGASHFQTDIRHPIRAMEWEHEHAGDALATMRALTGGFTPPADACNTYQALLAGLADLEADMHQHVHKENNILFPRAVSLQVSRDWPGDAQMATAPASAKIHR